MEGRRGMVIGRALLGLALGAATAAAVAGFVLADIYRPGSPWGQEWETAAWVRRSQRWTSFHEVASYLLLGASITGLFAWSVARAVTSAQRRAGLASGTIAAISAVVILATRPLVQWDQLALWAVTVGDDVGGYRYAATGDGVRFVLLGDVEVAQHDYAVALWVHLGAPVVAGLALLLAAWVISRQPPPWPRAGIRSPQEGCRPSVLPDADR